MASDVLMPQMGESIAEGTIVRWIKKVGDSVDRDEPLFEISTDKVDAEIPSPAAGVLTEIRAHEGETVPVNSVVAVIAPAGSAVVAAPPATPSPAEAHAAPPPAANPQADGASVAAPANGPAVPSREAAAAPDAAVPVARTGSTEDRLRQKSSPLVRRIAQEHQVDITQLHGTGVSGRVTKNDILAYIDSPARAGGNGAPTPGASARPAAPVSGHTPATGAGLAGQTVPLSVMRRKIAEHMVLSKRTSAHVHTVFEVNYSRVEQIRKAKKAEYEAGGGKLTYLSFIVKAAVEALRQLPVVNASLDANNNVLYHRPINMGIAVALDWGLIVPVIKGADEKSLLGISKSIADLAERARTKQLKPDDVAGGTFTVTNPGGIGAQFGLPIINQPQVAILGVGTIEKRVVVVDDAIGIRLMGYLSMAFDHRVVDGAVGDQFMALIKHQLENWDPSQA
ncbi:MAG TPA: dihydrolipoamide acetyltransferase family protein [Vicinamibacterales bacterium]|nr:dihydrolipoamide acetyltransferase family protein [Vicinamibacterales bacterium]